MLSTVVNYLKWLTESLLSGSPAFKSHLGPDCTSYFGLERHLQQRNGSRLQRAALELFSFSAVRVTATKD